MDLFADQRERNLEAAQPLAVRMRPRVLDEVVGQRHFLGAGKLLRRMIDADRLGSMVFYGPPGTGKTTLARVIADHTESRFALLNATSSNVKEVRQVLEAARETVGNGGRRTLLFLDELHRFNKAQQGHPARRRGERRDPAHRRDDREPVLRRQQRAGEPIARSFNSSR